MTLQFSVGVFLLFFIRMLSVYERPRRIVACLVRVLVESVWYAIAYEVAMRIRFASSYDINKSMSCQRQFTPMLRELYDIFTLILRKIYLVFASAPQPCHCM